MWKKIFGLAKNIDGEGKKEGGWVVCGFSPHVMAERQSSWVMERMRVATGAIVLLT